MARLTWDADGTRFFETGVKNCVLYTQVTSGNSTTWRGVAWNGITSISESPDGAEATDIYADDIKYASFRSAETFGGSIEAYTYPDEFMACDGSVEAAAGVVLGQQTRAKFALCYRTAIGSDQQSDLSQMYKLHIVYGCTVSPSEKTYETINDSPDANTFSWDFTSDPVSVTGHSPVSCITIDSRKANATKLATLLDTLYGSTNAEATLPMPDAVLSTMATG